MRNFTYLVAACVSVVLGGELSTALAQSDRGGFPVSGDVVTAGTLDPTVMGAEMYIGTPSPAAAPRGCEVAAQYARFINNGQFDRMAGLYANDGIVFAPASGMKARGREQIANFYENQVSKSKPKIIPVAYGTGPHECFQIQAVGRVVDGKEGFVLSTVDHFTFDNAGKIIRMIAYRRP